MPIRHHKLKQLGNVDLDAEFNSIFDCLDNFSDNFEKSPVLKSINSLQKSIESQNVDKNEITKLVKDQFSKIDTPLKNYSVLRLVSFYEFYNNLLFSNIIDELFMSKLGTLENEEDVQRPVQSNILLKFSVVKNEVNNFKSNPTYFDSTFSQIIQYIYEGTKNFNQKFPFLTFFKNVVTVNDIHGEYLKTKYNGSWFELINSLNRQRNNLTHDFEDIKLKHTEVEHILILYRSFFTILKPIIILVLDYFENGDNYNPDEKKYEKTRKEIHENTHHIALASYEKFYGNLNKLAFENNTRY